MVVSTKTILLKKQERINGLKGLLTDYNGYFNRLKQTFNRLINAAFSENSFKNSFA